MRVVDYIRISGREVSRQFVRSGLTIVALAISTVILVTLAAITIGGRRAIVKQLAPDNSMTSIIVTATKSSADLSLFGSVQEANDATAKLKDTSVAQLQAIPGVQSVVPRAGVWELQTFIVAGASKHFVAQAQGVSGTGVSGLAAGKTFTSDTAHEIILGKGYLKDLGITASEAIGKQINLTTVKGYRGDGAVIPPTGASQQTYDTFNNTPAQLTGTIVGVSGAGSDENKILLAMGWAHAIRTVEVSKTESVDHINEDGYTSINVTTVNPQAVKPVTEAIDKLGYGEISTLVLVNRLTQFSTIMWFVLGAVALIALLAASLGIVNTMLMTVAEQRYVIGVWRACGATRGMIAFQFLFQAIFLGLLGGTIGAGVGVAASRLVNDRIALILQAQHLPVVRIATAPVWLIGGSIALTTGFALIAGLYPAFWASRQDPSEILHSI